VIHGYNIFKQICDQLASLKNVLIISIDLYMQIAVVAVSVVNKGSQCFATTRIAESGNHYIVVFRTRMYPGASGGTGGGKSLYLQVIMCIPF
jgi:lipopolysaccharide/colanic/teichoic acid biosynthesis glycosyltransferase